MPSCTRVGVLGGDRERDERIVLGLEREHAVVPDLLEARVRARGRRADPRARSVVKTCTRRVRHPCSMAMRRRPASISARWVNACGKLPRCWPVVASISSAYRCSGPANDSSFWYSARARSTSPMMASADTSQNEQMVNVPSSPREPVVGVVDPVAQDEAVLGELVGDREDGGAHPLVVAGQEAHDRDEQVRRVERLGAVVLGEHAAVVGALVEDLGLDLLGRGLPALDALVVVALARETQRRGRRRPSTSPSTPRSASGRPASPRCPGRARGTARWPGRRGSRGRPRPRCGIWPPLPLVRADRVEQHPPHVVLVLVERAVADAHRPRVAVAGEVVERVLGEVGLAADAVHDLQVRARPPPSPAASVSSMNAKYSNASHSKPRSCSARSMNAVSRIHV